MRRIISALSAFIVALHTAPAEPCAPAYPPGAMVRIADESALILWDAEHKIEHFIRRATFTTSAADFGFLVPTPSRPELAEAGDEVFSSLENIIRPKTIYRHRISGAEPGLICLAPFFFSRGAVESAASAVEPSSVRVLETKRVAGYDAAVLEANNAKALEDWLQSHGYTTRPALASWLTPYIDQRWIITAFKIAGGPENKAVSTSAVRMSFKSERPFYPYREPSDQREFVQAKLSPEQQALIPPERLLRVFFVSTARSQGNIGGDPNPWRAKTVFADLLPADAGIPWPVKPAQPKLFLTAFEDRQNPRPGTDDIFFADHSNQTPVHPEPIYIDIPRKVFVPLDAIAIISFGIFWGVRRIRRRQAKPKAGQSA